MDATPLKRSISLTLLSFYALGNILGAGIYVLVGKVAGEAGYLSPLSFFIASIIAALNALTYAELSARFPHSGGLAIYIYQGFQRKYLALTAGLFIALSGIVSAATIAHGFAGYLEIFIKIPYWLSLLSVILIIGLITIWGINESVFIAAIFTVFEILGLCIILWVGRDSFNLDTLRESSEHFFQPIHWLQLSGILSGAFLAFYAYIGFEDVVNLAEEVKKPERNIPLAILFAVLISTILYTLISFVAITIVTPETLAKSDAPLALLFEQSTGKQPVLISFISMFAIINGMLIQFIMASRILYGMAKNKWLPDGLATVHPKTQTPVYASIIVIIVTMIFAFLLPITTLAKITSSLILVIFAAVNLALWRVKKTQPSARKIFTLPRFMPLCIFCITIIFIGLQLAM